jgi:hypothetical protein
MGEGGAAWRRAPEAPPQGRDGTRWGITVDEGIIISHSRWIVGVMDE